MHELRMQERIMNRVANLGDALRFVAHIESVSAGNLAKGEE